MAIANYGELKQAVGLWLNRQDLGENGPDFVGQDSLIESFISISERKIFRTLRCPANEKRVKYNLTEDRDYVVIPSDMLNIKTLLVNNKHWEFIGDSWFYKQNYQRTDCKFTRVTNQIRFPVDMGPDDEIEIIYWADLSGMDEDEEFNEILRIAPDLYLFGALIEAEAYIVNDPRVALWKQKFDMALDDLVTYSHHHDWSSSTVFMG